MSDIAEKVFDEALKGIGPALTSWRVFFCCIAILLVSPEFSMNAVYLLITSDAVRFYKKFIDWVFLVPVWQDVVVCVVFVFIFPRLNSEILFLVAKFFHAKRCGKLFDILKSLGNERPRKLASRYGKKLGDLHRRKIRAEGVILKFRTISEILLSASAMLMFLIIRFQWGEIFILPIVAILVVWFFLVSRKIIFTYLTEIEPFKIIVQSLREVGVVRIGRHPRP